MKNMHLFVKKEFIKLFLVSFVFSLFIVFIPWSSVRNYEFVDLSRNIEKYKYPYYYFDYYTNIFSIRSFVSDEPAWFYINLWSGILGVPAEVFFASLAVFCITIVCFYISKLSHYKYIVLLINPVSLDFFLSQQRSALCFVVILAFLSTVKKSKYILLMFLPLIHSLSAMLLLIFYFVENFINVKSKLILNFLLIFFFSLVCSIFIAFGRTLLSAYTDDSRFGEYDVMVNSYLYLMPWIIYYFWFVFLSRNKDRNYYLLICFLGIYVILTIFDFYAIRFLAMTIPFMIANLNNLQYKRYFIFIFSMHQMMLMYDWLKI